MQTDAPVRQIMLGSAKLGPQTGAFRMRGPGQPRLRVRSAIPADMDLDALSGRSCRNADGIDLLFVDIGRGRASRPPFGDEMGLDAKKGTPK